MFGLGRTSSSSSSVKYFDVRVKSTYKNLIIVRGSQYDSPSIMLTGDLVFSLSEEMAFKKIGLRLVGRYKLDFLEVLSQDNTTLSNPVKEESTVFEVMWENLLLNANGTIGPLEGSTSGTSTPTLATRRLIRSNTPLSMHMEPQKFASTPFEDMVVPTGTTFVLPEGNYELPFKCILPGDVPETVEGLLAGSILYKFEATMDRGGFKSPVMKYQYFRILRTLSSDNFSISETISIGKSWPDKVQYEVSIPSRAVPIGGSTPIKILLVPLCKGLKLGPIRAQMVQYYAFKGVTGDIYDDEQIIFDSTMTSMEGKVLEDTLSIDSSIKIPSNLKKVTQDCDLKGDMIKVRHKLKLQIILINDSGTTSELRTNIPISLFISPVVEVSGRTIMLDKQGKLHFRKEEDRLFNCQMTNHSSVGYNNQQQASSNSYDTPPNYEEHVYDQMIFNDGGLSSPTPVSSGVTTPVPMLSIADGAISNLINPSSISMMLMAQNTGAAADVSEYSDISNVPSYQDAIQGNDVPNPSEDFSPRYQTEGTTNT